MKTLRNLFAAALATAAIIFTVGCPGPSTPDTPEEPVAAVTFSPNGGAVNSGSTVTLETVTSDAEIWYAIAPETEITDDNVQEMLDKNSMTNSANVTVSVKIEKACTVYAVAVRTSTGKRSSVTKASYTLTKAPGTVTFTPGAGTVASGTKVKLSAKSAEGEESCTIYYSTSTALTAENYPTAGTVYDQAGDGIEITANTTIYAIAVGAAHAGNPSSAAYTLPVTLMNAAPEADDVVYIYYPKGKNVMLTTASGSNLSQVTVTLDESLGGFAVQDNMAALTVFKNDIGQYVFVSNGKYLTSGATGRSLTLADTFSYLALWDVVPVSSGSNLFYIHSANAIYGSSRQSLEYYSGFTVYTRNTTDIYQFQFYKDSSKTSELTAEAKASLAVSANTLEEPKFSEASGEVTPGTFTKLSSASLDAEFWYTTDSTKADKEHLLEMTKYDASKGIEITGNKGDTVTYYALAGRLKSAESTTEGVFSTAVASVTYTIGEDTNTYIQLATSLAENDVVAIYNPDSANSISATVKVSGFAPFATTVTAKGMVIKKGDVSENLTFFTAKEYVKGDYVFISGGKYLTSGATGSTLTLSESLTKYALWNLEEVNSGSNDGNFFIKSKNATFNGQNNQYIQYDKRTGNQNFVVYGKNNNEQFTYQFYKATDVQADTAQVKVFSPEFSVPSGQSVATDTPIVIESDTEGAEYYWKWKSEGDLTADNYLTTGKKYDATSEDGEPKVTKEDTLQAIAVKDGNVSNVVTATYSVDNRATSTADFAAAAKTEGISRKTDINVGNSWVVDDVTVETVKMTVAKQDYGYQLQKNSSAIIKSTSGKKIVKIEIKCTAVGYCKNASADTGSFVADTTSLTTTWTSTNILGVDSVTITASEAQLRISAITLTYAD